MTYLLLALCIVLTGAIVIILFLNARQRHRDSLAASSDAEQRRLSHEREQAQSAMQIETLRAQVQQMQQQAELLRTQAEDQRKALADQQEQAREFMRQQASDLRRESSAQFRALSAELLKAQSETLRTDNSRQLEALLSPLAQNISDFRKAVTDSYVQENATRKSLADQIERLMTLNESISTEARNLTQALKGNSKVQGDWGELILETLLEQAGLEKGVHFEVQATRNADGSLLASEAGERRRPDVIVNLPEGRRIIIDSKVSLTAYADACAAEDEDFARQRMKDHIDSVARHIDELADKQYQKIVRDSADYVFMFIPNEGAYIAAAHADHSLWQKAFSRSVVIVSPTHLFSVMQIVRELWVQERQNRHTLAIAEKGAKLHTKLTLFLESFSKIGDQLKAASACFEEAEQRLSTGRGNAIRLAMDLEDLGVKASKKIPTRLKEKQSDPEPPLLSE